MTVSETSENAILVVGSIAYDDIETPYSESKRVLGGSATFATIAASYFTTARLVGVVGNDFKQSDIEKLRNRGIDLQGMEINANLPTFYWKGRYHENFNRRDTLELKINAFSQFRPQLNETLRQTPFVMLGAIAPETQLDILEQLEMPQYIIADTFIEWIKMKRDSVIQVIQSIDLLIINDDELELLTGQSNIYTGVAELMKETRCPAFIIKKGEHGAILFHGEKCFAIPAYPVTELRDPTGAGDTFAATIIAYLAKTGNTQFSTIKQAMLYATAVASLTVEDFTCEKLEREGIDEIERRVQVIREMTTVA